MPAIDDPRLTAAGPARLGPGQVVHENPWFRVVDRGGYFTTEPREHTCAILPVVEHDSLVLVRARRPIIDDETWELPAGGLRLDRESAAAGAARELREETGIGIDDPARLVAQVPMGVAPNRDPRLTFIFRVDLGRAEFDGRGPHDQEISDVQCFDLAALRTMILNGDIYVALPVAIIGRYILGRTTAPAAAVRDPGSAPPSSA